MQISQFMKTKVGLNRTYGVHSGFGVMLECIEVVILFDMLSIYTLRQDLTRAEI